MTEINSDRVSDRGSVSGAVSGSDSLSDRASDRVSDTATDRTSDSESDSGSDSSIGSCESETDSLVQELVRAARQRPLPSVDPGEVAALFTPREEYLARERLLHDAIARNDFSVVDRLVSAAEVSVRRDCRSVMVATEKGHLDMVKYLLGHGALTNDRYEYFERYTPLHAATYSNRVEIVEVLLQNGAYVDATDESGNSCVIIATVFGYENIVLALLRASANVHMTDRWYRSTALHLGASLGYTNICDMLLRANARVDACNENGVTSLMLACEFGMFETVQSLLVAGADPNRQSNDGNTALHMLFKATVHRSRELDLGAFVDELMAHGAHPDILNAGHFTAIDCLRYLSNVSTSDKQKIIAKLLPLPLTCLAAAAVAKLPPSNSLPKRLRHFVALHADQQRSPS